MSVMLIRFLGVGHIDTSIDVGLCGGGLNALWIFFFGLVELLCSLVLLYGI